jgi:hypothetical protein
MTLSRAITLAIVLALFGGAITGAGWTIWLFFTHPTFGLLMLLGVFFAAILTM